MPAPSAPRCGAPIGSTSSPRRVICRKWPESAHDPEKWEPVFGIDHAHGKERKQMALLINDACTACDACEPVCPNNAITAGNPIYVIDALKCTECVGAEDEPQCKLVCPADCIVPNPDFEESQDELMAKYQSLHG
jgi:ferredoxin